MKKNRIIFFLQFLAILLFWFSNPNFLFLNGISIFAFFLYIPILLIVKESEYKNVWIHGCIFGLIAYGFYVNWLISYNLVFFFLICILYSLLYAVLFIFLKFADRLFKKYYWIVQCFVICGFEYLKTLGFLGFGYGVTAYTQWRNIYLIQICNLIGVFGLNFLIIFFSCCCYSIIRKIDERNKFLKMHNEQTLEHCNGVKKCSDMDKELRNFSLHETFMLCGMWCIAMVLSFIYGKNQVRSKIPYKDITVAAIQNNEHSWENGFEVYYNSIKNLIKLTDEAIAFNPEIKLVVWPETAVVPSVIKYYENKNDERRNKLICLLLEYINSKESVFVIGNAHKENQFSYNSSLIFLPKTNVIPPKPFIYSKIHLVPFSEEFAFKDKFPFVEQKLIDLGFQHWNAGIDYKVFDMNGFHFSTPICFEDNFSDVCRKMVVNGAKCFINLSNDSWSRSSVAQTQHLAMAVFRSVENKVPSVRCTTSGVSCIINQYGQIERKTEDFCQSYVIGKVPVIPDARKLTVFSKYGDIAGNIEIILAIIMLIIQLIIVTIDGRLHNNKSGITNGRKK